MKEEKLVRPVEVPVRKSVVSDKWTTWNDTNKTAEDQGPWQRKFELQINAFMAKASESNSEKFDFLVSKYSSLTNILKTNDLHAGMPLEYFNILRVKNSGIKRHYADTNKTKIAKEEFFEMEQSILVFTKDGQTTNRVIYYQGKTNKVKENIYLINGKIKETIKIFKNENIKGLGSISGDKSSKWAVYGAYYKKLVGAANHQDTIAIPSANSFSSATDALYGVEGSVSATLSRLNIDTDTTLRNAIINERHLRILKASIVGELQEYDGDFLYPSLPSGNHDIVKFTFAFEDWKVPDDKGVEGSGDYNDGELIVVIGRKQKVSAANFTKMWNAHPGNVGAGYCPSNVNGCATHFSDAVFTSSGLGINLEAWKYYMKSKSPLKPNNNHETYIATSKTVWGYSTERVIRANEIYMFLAEVIIDGSFTKRQSHQGKANYDGKKGLVFFENCWGGGDHIDLWDGTKDGGNGQFKYWGNYEDPSQGPGAHFDYSKDGKPCPIYFLEF